MMKSMITELPDLATECPLSHEQIERYRQNGHIVLRGVASAAEVAAYRPHITEAASLYLTETRPLAERDSYGKAFLQITNLWERDEAVRRFVLARRFAKIAADLMGIDGVRIFHDQALFKEPGGGFTPWHQDQIYWPLDTTNTITMWMPLMDISAEMGSMTFVSRSHTLDYRNTLGISDRSEAVLQQYILDHNLPQVTHGAMVAGDVTFHAGWTMHRAPGNSTEIMREVMTVIYFADGTRLLTNPHPLQEGDFIWFPGRSPGEVAASPRTPCVYRRPNDQSIQE